MLRSQIKQETVLSSPIFWSNLCRTRTISFRNVRQNSSVKTPRLKAFFVGKFQTKIKFQHQIQGYSDYTSAFTPLNSSVFSTQNPGFRMGSLAPMFFLRNKFGQSQDLPHLFPFFLGSLTFAIHCPLSEKCCFCILFSVSVVKGWKVNISFPSWSVVGVRIHFYSFMKHIFLLHIQF